MKFDISKSPYRSLVVGVNTKIPLANGRKITAINFDNAATTPPFVSVMEEISNFSPWYSSIHRGTGFKSLISSNAFENGRIIVSKFVNSDMDYNTVIFVKNTTEAINKLSNRICKGESDCIVLSTGMEHHSNDLPWRRNFKVDFIETDSCGKLNLINLEDKLNKYKGKVKLVAVTGASNVSGYINPIHQIASIVHSHGSKLLVDGAQLIPHVPVDMKPVDSPEHIDYLAFSAHKMYAPFGIGVLIGPKETFESGDPDYVGGGTVNIVTPDLVLWDDPPAKDEAGTPNIMGVVALIASIKTLTKLDMNRIEGYENTLCNYAIEKIKSIPDVDIYCREDNSPHVGIIPLNIKDVHHNIIANALSYESGIAVRNGCFCAQPYIQKLLNVNKEQIQKNMMSKSAPRPGMVRISFGLYNDSGEVDVLVKKLKEIAENKEYYIKKYANML